MTLSMQLHKVNVDKITADMCTFGKLHTLTIKIALNSGFTFGMGTINKILAKHTIAIPSKIGKYFELSDLTIGYHDNYLALGLTPTFVGPTAPTLFLADVAAVRAGRITAVAHFCLNQNPSDFLVSDAPRCPFLRRSRICCRYKPMRII